MGEGIIFKKEEICKSQVSHNTWKILIADDEPEIHVITKMVLRQVSFLEKPLEFLSAYSGNEARKMIIENPDIALILLDVVMESDSSGLEVVKFIREELKNSLVRIVFRTGMPGQAPEREVIDNYDINDYKEKTELTAQKLYTTVVAGLRNYRDLLKIEESKLEMEKTMLYFRHLINSMLSGVLVINADYRIEVYTKQVVEYIRGENGNDISGMNLFDAVPFFADYRKDIDLVLQQQCRQEKMMIPISGGRIMNLIFCPLDEIGNRVVIRVDDMTALVEKERQLMHLQKLEMVGMLAAGVTHDFNNILGGISGTVSLMQLDCQESCGNVLMETQQYHEYLEQISQSVSRATELSKKLVSLSKSGISQMKWMDLCNVIFTALAVCRASISRSVVIETDIRCSSAPLWGDAGTLEQMLLNLCINAGHAMTIMRSEHPEDWHGTLIVMLEQQEAPERLGIRTKECYFLSVKDTGVGMSQEVKEKIFNPFFSTKKKGEGTGLGLLMVHNIIHAHHGVLEVFSEPGKGTDFRVYFPIFREGDVL